MAEELRLEASVVDKFSKPLRDLRDRLREVKTPDGLKRAGEDFGKVEGAVRNATKSITGGLTTAMSGLGLASLGATASVAGVIAAVKGFSSSTIELKQFNRETGLAISTLKAFKHAASQFGVDEDTVAPALKKMTESLRDIQRRTPGTVYDGLIHVDGQLMKDLAGKNADQALAIIEKELARVATQTPDGAKQAGMIAERIFGTSDMARFALRGSGALREVLNEAMKGGGPSDDDEKKAIAFAAAVERLQEAFSKLGKTVGNEVSGPLTAVMDTIDKFIEENKGAVGAGLQTAAHDIGKAFRETDWRQVGEGIKDIGSGFLSTVQAVSQINAFIDKYAGFLNANPAEAGTSSAHFLNRFLSGKDMGARGDLDEARENLADYDRAHPHSGVAGLRGANTPERRALVDQIEKLEEATRKGTSAGIQEGLKLYQQQSFTGVGVGGGAALIRASYSGGGGFSGGSYRRSLGGGSGGGDNDISSGAAPGRFAGGKTFVQKAPEVMARLMQDFKLSREEAGAIVGNLGHESAGFQAFNEGGNGPGRGWAQWTDPGRKSRFYAFAKSHGLDIHSDEANYGFLKWELQHTHRSSIDALRRAVGPEAKMEAFERSYEGAGVKSYGSRRRYMEEAIRGSLLRQHRDAEGGGRGAAGGKAGLDVTIHDGRRISTKANGGSLFDRMDVNRGRTMVGAPIDA